MIMSENLFYKTIFFVLIEQTGTLLRPVQLVFGYFQHDFFLEMDANCEFLR